MSLTNLTSRTVFKIPSFNLGELSIRLVKLNKRALKLGVPEIQSRVLSVIPPIYSPSGKLDSPQYYEVELLGSAPKLAGWTFLGTIEHTQHGNILRSTPSQEIPETFRNAPKVCDHCQTIRNRKDTYLVKNEAGEIKQIGHNCIKDFLGHVSPEQLGFAAEWITEFEELRTGDFSGGAAGGISMHDFLIVVSELTLQKGYSKGETASEALSQIINRAEHEKRGTKIELTEKGYTFKEKALTWIRICEAHNGYLLNLKISVLDAQDNPLKGITRKNAGLIGSLIQAYLRAVETAQIKKFTPKPTSQFVGTVGEKLELTLRLKRKMSFPNTYGRGDSFILLFEDCAGNAFKWCTANGSGFIETEEVKLKGTVKAHEEYKGTPQTVLTRCSLSTT